MSNTNDRAQIAGRAPRTPGNPARPSTLRRPNAVARFVARNPRVRLATELLPPLAWLGIIYIGSLIALVITSLFSYKSDPTGLITKLDSQLTTTNFQRLFNTHAYRIVTWRTLQAAAIVTVLDAIIAIPVAFYIAKVASTWARRGLIVAITMPLWAGYLVKGYAWRSILDPQGGAL